MLEVGYRQLSWRDVEVGNELPTLTLDITLRRLFVNAAASWDTFPAISTVITRELTGTRTSSPTPACCWPSRTGRSRTGPAREHRSYGASSPWAARCIQGIGYMAQASSLLVDTKTTSTWWTWTSNSACWAIAVPTQSPPSNCRQAQPPSTAILVQRPGVKGKPMTAAPSPTDSRRLEEIIDLNLLAQQSFCAVFQDTAARFPDWVAVRTLDGRTSLTWTEYAERVEAIARGLAAVGVGRGATVGYLMSNRPEFFPADLAAMHLGAACLSIYQTLPANDIGWAMQDSGTTVMFTDLVSLPAVLAGAQDLPAGSPRADRRFVPRRH